MPQTDLNDKSPVSSEYIREKSFTVSLNERQDPEFIRDVCPYFAPAIANLCVHLSFIYTGNILIGAWLMLALTPFYNLWWQGGGDNENISQKNEKIWMKSKMFLIPLYAYVFT